MEADSAVPRLAILFIGSNAISSVGDWASRMALTFALLDSSNPGKLAVVTATREIAATLSVLPGAVIADRLHPKRLLIACNVLRVMSQVAVAAEFGFGGGKWYVLAVLVAVSGVGMGLSRPASTALIPVAFSGDHVQQMHALNGVGLNLVGVIDGALGALIYRNLGASIALCIDAASFLVAAVMVFSIPVRHVVAEHNGWGLRSVMDDIGKGWNEVCSRRWLVLMLGNASAYHMVAMPCLLVLGPTALNERGSGSAKWAIVLGADALGSIVGGLIASRIHSRAPMVAVCRLVLVSSGWLFALAFGLPVAGVAFFAFTAGIALNVAEPVWLGFIQHHIPEGMMARVSSFDWFVSLALSPIGFFLASRLQSDGGPERPLFLAGLVVVMANGLTMLVPEVRRQRGSETEVS